MDLWIRSQDREHLMKTTDIDLSCDDKSVILINNYEMAKYKTKERALEVLDEIHNIIQAKYATSFDYEKALSSFGEDDKKYMLKQMAVYEMPKK